MFLSSIANYVSKREVVGTKGTYIFLKFVDELEKEIEVQIPSGQPIPAVKRFASYRITVDIVQGQYPRYFLMGICTSKSEDVK